MNGKFFNRSQILSWIVLIIGSISFSAMGGNEWKTCENCHEDFQPTAGMSVSQFQMYTLERIGDTEDGIRGFFCQNRACQNRRKELKSIAAKKRAARQRAEQKAASENAKYSQKRDALMNSLADYCKTSAAENVPAEKQIPVINQKLQQAKALTKGGRDMNLFWGKIASRASLPVVKYYWPAIRNEKDFKRFRDISKKGSVKSGPCALALGRHIGGNPQELENICGGRCCLALIKEWHTIRFVNTYTNDILSEVFWQDRADVLEYFLNQCMGNADFMCYLISRDLGYHWNAANHVCNNLKKEIQEAEAVAQKTVDSDERAVADKKLNALRQKYNELNSNMCEDRPKTLALVLSRSTPQAVNMLQQYVNGHHYCCDDNVTGRWRNKDGDIMRFDDFCFEKEKHKSFAMPAFTANAAILNLGKDPSVSQYNPAYIKKDGRWTWCAGVASPFMPGYVSGTAEHNWVWKAGLQHPSLLGAVSAAKENKWDLVVGYKETADGSIVWMKGSKHPTKKGLIASEQSGKWSVLPGYTRQKNGAYEWTPGWVDTKKVGRFAAGTEGKWELLDGFTDKGKDKIVWTPGTAHKKNSHVVAGTKRFQWVPAPGYQWSDPAKEDNLQVVKK